MKLRRDFVTNSSSSSFIFTNNTSEVLTSEEFMKKFLSKVIEDSKDTFVLAPGESIEVECSDGGDNVFEKFIHSVCDNWSFHETWSDPNVIVSFHESHH